VRTKVAIITGGASGIGYAVACRLAANGARLVLSGRDAARGDNAEQMLRDGGAEALFVQGDIAIEADVAALISAAVERFGAIDMLVNNAGPSGEDFAIGPLHELSSTAFDRAMRIGGYGPFWCCKYALPHMIQAGGGSIVNISAVAAVRALPNFGGYALSKALLETLGRQVANDYAAHNIRCNTLLVGTVRPADGDISTLPTGFDTDAIDARIGQTTMLGRVGKYADVAETAVFLLSDASAYITGASIPVDGGATAKLQYPNYETALPRAKGERR
jgi:NAD(P)-dependent dehydrogenase (short-subunit alcohol dehydrogenase family)